MPFTEKLDPLSPAVIDHLKNRGMNQSEIARMYDVTRQYISWIKYYHGGRLTPREVILQSFPFKVPAELTQASPYRRLRDHGEYVATGGVGMSTDKIKRLRSFYRNMRSAVVEFDPDLPPSPGVANKGGWAFRQRTLVDENRLIRVNDHTVLTDDGDEIWRVPPIEP